MKVILLMAMTLDGKIAKNDHHFPDWTGSADKKFFVEITKKAGVMIMGSKTFDAIGKPLPERKNIVMTRDRSRCSVEPELVFTDQSPASILQDLDKMGHTEVILAGGSIVNSLFARENLIDEIIITVAPRVFGTGISFLTEEMDLQLERVAVETMGRDHVLLNYRVCR